MQNSTSLKQAVLDVFQTHNPIKASCLSVYQPIVTDLLRYWSYEDTQGDVELYLTDLFVYHHRKSVVLSKQLVADVYACRAQF